MKICLKFDLVLEMCYFKITLFKLETCFLEETNNQHKKEQLAVSPFFPGYEAVPHRTRTETSVAALRKIKKVCSARIT